jgi:hypothetical protein
MTGHVACMGETRNSYISSIFEGKRVLGVHGRMALEVTERP